MFEGLTDDDDALFTTASSSNLASLFGVATTQSHISANNTSLTYTAPKQPTNNAKKTLKNSTNKKQSSLIVFKEVHAFKVVDKKYMNQGKCGIALIGNDNVLIYQLLLYKHKNDIISTTKVSHQFTLICQRDNHVSYSDDQKQNWTINFNSESDLNEFCSILESRGGKLVKINEPEANISSNAQNVTTKNYENHTNSDNQPDTVSSCERANILCRMAKMGQKLLPNSSISEGTDAGIEKDKLLSHNSKIIERETDEADTLKSNSTEISKKIHLPPKCIQSPSYSQPIAQQYAIINGQAVTVMSSHISQEPNSTHQSKSPVENKALPVMYASLLSPPHDLLQMYFTENRTHNSEVRMNMLRLTNKMEEVLEKLGTKSDTATSESKIKDNSLHEEIINLKATINKLECDIERSKDEFSLKEQQLLTENFMLKKEIEKHTENKKTYQQDIIDSKLKVTENTATVNTEPDDDKSNENVIQSIKKIMNNLYCEIIEEIQLSEMAQSEDFKTILAQKIRINTFSIISSVGELKSSKNCK